LTGASTGRTTDDALAEVEAISWRAPFQSSIPLREQINDGRVAFVDMHLSHLPQSVLFGFFGKIDFAVIEATEITTDGRVYLSTSIGASPTFLQAAEKVVIEVNRRQPPRISETADILVPEPPPFRRALNLDHPLQRIGRTYADVEPQKIIGVVLTDEPDDQRRVQGDRPSRCRVFGKRASMWPRAAGVLADSKRRGQSGERSAERHWRQPGDSRLFNVQRGASIRGLRNDFLWPGARRQYLRSGAHTLANTTVRARV
jgi:acyl-CoA hydrolase